MLTKMGVTRIPVDLQEDAALVSDNQNDHSCTPVSYTHLDVYKRQ